MIRPEDFKKTADEALGGLTAGPALLNRARMQAAGQPAGRPVRPARRVLAMALSLGLVLAVSALALPRLWQKPIPVLSTRQAGPESAAGLRESADLPRGSLTLTPGSKQDSQGVWARGHGANFPLIRVDGRYYRLLTHPADVTALQGGELGRVQVFMDEPALDNTDALLSNVAAMDAPVYGIPGMGKSAVAALVNGESRLFQRVSFAGNGLVGSESLRDTLPAGAVGLQLGGVGTLTDRATVTRLMDLLYGSANYRGSQSRSGGQVLLVQYENGVVLQMNVNGDQLSACGTWDCAEFIEEFGKAAGS